MTDDTFKSLMGEARVLGETCPESDAYAGGYQRGLRRLHYGERFGDPGQHETWMALDPADPDRSRADRARGYRDGFEGRAPVWPAAE